MSIINPFIKGLSNIKESTLSVNDGKEIFAVYMLILKNLEILKNLPDPNNTLPNRKKALENTVYELQFTDANAEKVKREAELKYNDIINEKKFSEAIRKLEKQEIHSIEIVVLFHEKIQFILDRLEVEKLSANTSKSGVELVQDVINLKTELMDAITNERYEIFDDMTMTKDVRRKYPLFITLFSDANLKKYILKLANEQKKD